MRMYNYFECYKNQRQKDEKIKLFILTKYDKYEDYEPNISMFGFNKFYEKRYGYKDYNMTKYKKLKKKIQIKL